jgi:hypothetical protein
MSPFDDYAVMVICAGDVDQIWHLATNNGANPQANPTLPSAAAIVADGIGYIHDGAFEALGQVRCDDTYIAKANNVYYGLLLRAKQAVGPVGAGDYLLAIRGTMDAEEWANDATAELPDYQTGHAGAAGTGFWAVYASMTYGDLTGASQKPNAAAEVAAVIKAAPAPVFVIGHSLGAVLATYAARDLQGRLAGAVTMTPYVFASPKPGTQDFADNYQQTVPIYTVCNYAADLVPMLPSSPPFVALNAGGPTHDVHVIPVTDPNAPPLFPPDVGRNHNPATYAHMLDPTNATAIRLLSK